MNGMQKVQKVWNKVLGNNIKALGNNKSEGLEFLMNGEPKVNNLTGKIVKTIKTMTDGMKNVSKGLKEYIAVTKETTKGFYETKDALGKYMTSIDQAYRPMQEAYNLA